MKDEGQDLNHCPSDEDFSRAVAILAQGGIVAFPTETFYGLAVDPFNDQALTALFRLKGRPLHKPFPVLVQDEGQLSGLANAIPRLYRPLMKTFWPGPLTLVFPARPELSSFLTGEGAGVGVRISPHPVARKLGQRWGRPMTATSANPSGMPAARSADEVRHFFGGEVAFILDGGQTPGGMSSTVVGLRQGGVQLIRAGVIDFSLLLQVVKAEGSGMLEESDW